MNETIAQQLLALNRSFYDQVAEPFAQSRARPQPGFNLLLEHLPRPCPHLLELGCGEGRFGRFLLDRQAITAYTGIDFSAPLLAKAAALTPGTFLERDISQPGSLEGVGSFTAIACLAVLQHIPGRENRVRLLREIGRHLGERGRVVLSSWQFQTSQRQQRKIVEWATIGLDQSDIEADDYLLTWQRGGTALRYVCLINADETVALAAAAGLTCLHQFRSDGKEGDLSLYSILAKEGVDSKQ
ncbi:MAG: class I SAM-dependent methyltransferase [Chloroflexi bacterium]|nr:class I SAM-dependent methyltransferase [Chloroflexota bacterium]MBP8055035.1 class I SAM-dependent methyltransferase [Chloroflexota bacterium]